MGIDLFSERKPIKFISPNKNGDEIIISGYIKNIRRVSKKLTFIIVEDRTGDAQVTIREGDIERETLKETEKFTPQSVIWVYGIINKSQYCKRGVEVIAKKIQILSRSETPLPLDITGKTNPSLNIRLDWRFLDLRRKHNQTIIMILSDFVKFSRDFFNNKGFIEIFTPKLIGAPSEGGAEVFEVKYFDRKAYLAQSPQFYKQMAISAGFEKVYEIAPVFRANPSFTRRHDTEFTSLDIEMAYINSFEDIMQLEEKWITYIIGEIKKQWEDIIREEYGVTIQVPTTPFPRITMKEARKIVKSMGVELKDNYDIGTKGEKAIGKYIKDRFGHEFAFITYFPWEIRPFYHMKSVNSPNLTLSYDLLWKGLEITTGAQREHRYKILVEQAKEKGLNLDLIKFYLDFFKFGCPPHGGFGLSPTRFIMQLLNLENVKEATLVPRDPNRVIP